MNTYYIFDIKENIYNIYKNNKHELYKILYNLYKLKKIDYNYGLSLYNQICKKIKTKKLTAYIELLKTTNTKNIEKLKIKPSRIIYNSNIINKDICFILNNYSKHMFICDFNKKEYNWINNVE